VTAKLLRRSQRFDVTSFSFIKIARKKSDYGIERFLLVDTFGDDAQFGAATGSERKDAENRFGIGFEIAVETMKCEAAFETARDAHKVGGSASV